MAIAPVRPGVLQHRPFRASDAIRQGLLTRDQLRSKAWRRIFRDVYVDARKPDTHRLRILGAALVIPPGAVITGRSAAHLWGAELAEPDTPVEILTPTRFGPMSGLAIRLGLLAPDEMTTRADVPVSSALHTTWELARALPEADALVWIDALGRSRALSRTAVIEHATRHLDEYGYIRAANTLVLCDPRAESPPETRLRVAIVRAGMPAPVPQYRVFVGKLFLARVDLAWPKIKFAIEYDGQWHVDGNQLTHDRSRLRELNEAGWYVYHVTRDDMRDPDALLASLASVLAKRTREFAR